MPQDRNIYSGYTDTLTVRRLAGIEKDTDISDIDVNDKIKAAEQFINRLSQHTFTIPVASDLKLACSYLASAMIKLHMDDEKKNYENHWNMGLQLLQQFVISDTQTLLEKYGFMVVSEANTSPANPDALPYITDFSKSKKDFIPFKLPRHRS